MNLLVLQAFWQLLRFDFLVTEMTFAPYTRKSVTPTSENPKNTSTRSQKFAPLWT